MKVVRGYKTELDLNNEQRTACLKYAGGGRSLYLQLGAGSFD